MPSSLHHAPPAAARNRQISGAGHDGVLALLPPVVPRRRRKLVEPIRWIRGAVPAVTLALVGVAALARPPVLEAADPPWDPPPCPAAAAAVTEQVPVWYRLDGVVDDAGSLTGQRLTLGPAGGAGVPPTWPLLRP